ncbi:MAG TPA: hypothetical protein DDZ40_06250, partial [Deltaproteobacteria bacterium]|nr:hypothetical protein [Deltaproteobacteria bacterium]
MTVKEKSRKIWDTLRPDQKKKLGYTAVIVCIIIFSLALYKSNHKTSAPPQVKVERKRELGIDKSSVLEKSHYNEAQQSVTRLQKQVDEMKQKLEEKGNGKEPGDPPTP